MEDNPSLQLPPREWVCEKCGKTFPARKSHNGHQKTHGRYGKNQIVPPERPEQSPEALEGPRTRSVCVAAPRLPSVELGIGPDPLGRIPDERPPTLHQFLPLPKDDKAD
ncbi:uncharacterized protein LOC131057120 [Cryptomeria japonica]|uniref:uncharacterized protein LOC131057120 n=1 Tax=Cryptomeria japonica TaxID=3369 RepID=UPI0027DA8E36|nr:uncharacterized protein LOC131057120 [Cryptomeria japonica]